ncbi:MAG TPA: hypothetical protein VM030_08215 [Acidimicrobiales bacterium]|nr:hypothetical protein [Acidimicrobiales bacterium]
MTGALGGGLAAAALLPARPEVPTAPTTRVMGASYERTPAIGHHWDRPPRIHR